MILAASLLIFVGVLCGLWALVNIILGGSSGIEGAEWSSRQVMWSAPASITALATGFWLL